MWIYIIEDSVKKRLFISKSLKSRKHNFDRLTKWRNLDFLSAPLISILWKGLTYHINVKQWIIKLYKMSAVISIHHRINQTFSFFVKLERSQMSLSKLGTQVNQIKWDWAYQSSGLFEDPCWLPEHKSSFILNQSTWWINSPPECLAPSLH